MRSVVPIFIVRAAGTDLGSQAYPATYHEYVHRVTATSEIRFPTGLVEGFHAQAAVLPP